jgi:hypothetical protein
MSEYDDTDKGVLWKPRSDQALRAIGKVNNNGEEKNTLLMACKTRDGEKYYELYQKVSSVYAREEGANPSAPDFSGPFGETRRIAMWVNEFPSGHAQEGTKYLKATVSDKMQTDTSPTTTTAEPTTEDKIQDIKDSFAKAESGDDWNDQF